VVIMVLGSENNGIHSKFKNVRKSENVRSYHKDASFYRTSDILILSYIQ